MNHRRHDSVSLGRSASLGRWREDTAETIISLCSSLFNWIPLGWGILTLRLFCFFKYLLLISYTHTDTHFSLLWSSACPTTCGPHASLHYFHKGAVTTTWIQLSVIYCMHYIIFCNCSVSRNCTLKWTHGFDMQQAEDSRKNTSRFYNNNHSSVPSSLHS